MEAADQGVLFLRLEGPLQSWGIGAKWIIRETAAEPTKSGVVGLLCCALGRKRHESVADFRALRMGVRVDRPGTRWRDYHTAGAGIGMLSAEGVIKRTGSTGEVETLVSLRYYLSDASFLVALTGPEELLTKTARALWEPVWPVYLGRKSCPPSRPVFEKMERHSDLLAALRAQPWRPRLEDVDRKPGQLRYVIESAPSAPEAYATYDEPVCFEPPTYEARYVREFLLPVEAVGAPSQLSAPRFTRWRMNYRAKSWKAARNDRSEFDNYLCVFCKLPSKPVHHVTYARSNDERREDLRSVCALCHDAVTMIESEKGMTKERIDPESPAYRQLILRRRDEILRNRAPRHSHQRR